MENIYSQPGLYAFAHPQEVHPTLILVKKATPRGLVWPSHLGTFDLKKIQQSQAYKDLKKQLAQ